MAKKRMFDRAILDTDRFMDMPMSAKAIYFLLGMEADDEGFISYKKVIRIHGGNEDDIKVLVSKEFVIPFESGVVVITDWNKNNWLDSRRIVPTEYQKERKQLVLTDSKEYVLSIGLESIEQNSIEQNRTGGRLAATMGKKKFSVEGAEVIKAFEAIDAKNKTYYGNTTQRAASDFLIQTYGLDVILSTIPKLKETNKKSLYQITTPLEMKDKITKVFNDLSRKKSEQGEKSKVNIY